MGTSDNFEKLSAVVVEDNTKMRRLMEKFLISLNIGKVKFATDVPTGLATLKFFPADFVITTWNMKPMDGIEFIRLIRTAVDSANPFVPIIMLTRFAEVELVFRARDAGVNEFLAEPFSAESLQSRITKVINNSRPLIRDESYFGPDRRRRDLPAPDEIDRRCAA